MALESDPAASASAKEQPAPAQVRSPAAGSRRPVARLAGAWRGAVLGALAGFLIRDLDLPALISYDHPREPLVLLAAALGLLVGTTRYRWTLRAGTLALGMLWCLAAFTPLCGWLAQGLSRREVEEAADAVVVSLAGLVPDGQSAAEVRSRILHGADLVARGKATHLVLAEAPDLPGRETARETLGRLGVTAEVLVAGKAETTRQEAVAVAGLYRERGWKLILLVTSPIHSRRASAAFEKEGMAVVSSPSPETRFDLDTLDTWSDRLSAFGSVIHERLGIWVYRQRGWVAG